MSGQTPGPWPLAEAEALIEQARTGRSDLERRLAASVLLAQQFHLSRLTMTTPSESTQSAGSSTMFKKATKQQAKLRMALTGPAGSGKTYNALLVAKHLGGKVAVIDTEHGSASKYADKFEFDAAELELFSIDNYLKAISAAAEAGYDVLIVDSLSHAWTGKGGALEEVDRVTAASRTGNKFTAGWGVVTPKHNRLVDALVAFPGHVIATIRTKTEYVLEEKNGQKVPRKVGMAPVQRDGMEYEFDVFIELDREGAVTVSKTRFDGLSGSAGMLTYADVPKMTKTLAAWLADGAPRPPPVPSEPQSTTATPQPAQAAPQSSTPQPRPAVGALPQPSPLEQFEIAIGEAQTTVDLDKLVPRLQRLPKSEQAVLRPKWMKRKHELAATGAGKEVSNVSPIRQ